MQNTKKGSDLQIDLMEVSENTLKFEEKNIKYKGQSHDFGAYVKWASMIEIDSVMGPHNSNEVELEKINYLKLGLHQMF